MSTASVRNDLLGSLRDQEYRKAFVLENVYTSLCFQLRAMREQRGMSQAELGCAVLPKMAQERISILEDPNAETKPTLTTLLRLANAFDVGLAVRFIPLATLLTNAVQTDMEELRVNGIEEDFEAVKKQIEFELAAEKRRLRAFQRDSLGLQVQEETAQAGEAASAAGQLGTQPELGVGVIGAGTALLSA